MDDLAWSKAGEASSRRDGTEWVWLQVLQPSRHAPIQSRPLAIKGLWWVWFSELSLHGIHPWRDSSVA